MSSIRGDIKGLIDKFLNQDLGKRTGIETVVLCGSQASGRATSKSDIDLCYIGNFPAFKREVVYFQDQEFQLMIAPWEWYEDVIKSYERKDNKGTITSMLSHGICVHGESERWINLRDLSRQYFELGACQSSEKDLHCIRMLITGLWENYSDQLPETINQLWLSYNLIKVCIESQFKIKSWWEVKPKYQIEELEKKDSCMARLVIDCLQSKGTDKALIYQLCEYVLRPIGGFLKENWTSE
jgi:hypothetical protein